MVEQGDKTSYTIIIIAKAIIQEVAERYNTTEQNQSARDACKQVIKHAREKAWSEYGNHLEDMRKQKR